MVTSFCPSHAQLAEVGIKAALRDILNKGVLLYVPTCVHVYVCDNLHSIPRSLDPIFESPRIDMDLRSLVKTTFSEFIQPRKPLVKIGPFIYP